MLLNCYVWWQGDAPALEGVFHILWYVHHILLQSQTSEFKNGVSDKMKHCHLLSGGTEGVRNQRNTTLKEKTSCQVKPWSAYLPACSHCPKSPRMSASVHLQEVLSNPDPSATTGLWEALHQAYPTCLISSPDQSLRVSTLSPLSFCLEPGFLPNKKSSV